MNFEHPDYWQTLSAWAVADPKQAASRARRLNEHRQLVAEITARMYLRESPPELAVVVIPFDSLSSDPDDAYLADGLAVEVMTSLKTVPGLRVAPQSSSFYYRDNPAPYSEIGTTLNVTHVLEGSVRRGGDRLSVRAGLVEIASGEEIWSHSFEHAADDLLELQAALAGAIVDTLAPHVSAAEPRAAADVGTFSAAAFDYYMRARNLLRQDNAEDFAKAVQLLQAALNEDPRFLRAYGSLREATLRMPFRGDGDFETAYSRAEEIRAVMAQLDPEAAQPASMQAVFASHWLDRDYSAAEEVARRALARDPTDTEWLAVYTMLLKNSGVFAAALAYSERLRELDPFNANTLEQIGDVLLALDQETEAQDAYQRCLQLAPRRDGCKGQLAITLVRLGRAEEARQLYENSSIPPVFLCVLFDQLSACDPGLAGETLGSRAAMATKLGQLEVADALLREAADQPFAPEIQIRWSKLHLGFRQERPAYRHLLDRLNLTDAWKTELCQRAQTLTPATGIPVTCD